MSRIYLSPPDLDEADLRAVQRALQSGWIAPFGPELEGFEADLSTQLENQPVLATSSGTAALHLALLALGIARGDRVLVADWTFAAAVNAALYCGALPVFVDAEPTSWGPDPDAVGTAATTLRRRGTPARALISVDLYGQCADNRRLAEVCQGENLIFVEDAAEALGARRDGQPAGTFGRAGILSFNGNKIVTTSGGGALTSPDQELLGRARHLANQAREPAIHFEHRETGYNYRLSNILAALGRSQLARLPEKIARRRAIRDTYRAILEPAGWQAMPIPADSEPNHWLACFLLPDGSRPPGEIAAELGSAGIETRPLWKPMSLQPAFRHLEVFGNGLAQRLYARGLCLPSGTGLQDEEVEAIAHQLLRVAG